MNTLFYITELRLNRYYSMIVVIPTDFTHNIKLIPRYSPTGALTFITYNESTQESATISNTYVIANGVLTLTFDFTFVEDDKLQFEIQESGTVVFRGKMFATTQVPQDYKLTNGLYFYE